MEKNNYDYEKIFHMYTKFRLASFSNIMSYDNQIFKFKDKIHTFNKTLKEMEHSLLPKKTDEKVEIFIKEDKKIKKYEEQSRSDQDEPQNNSSNSEDNDTNEKKEEKTDKENEMKKTKSEPKIEVVVEKGNNDNTNNENNDNEKQKTFNLIGSFPDYAISLIKRGWKADPEPDKLNYEFIYSNKMADIPFEMLGENVIIGHHKKIGEITRKGGLLKNLRNLYYLNVSPDDFYPRAYDLSEKQDIEDFIEDFKVSKAISLLRKCNELKGKNVNKKEIEISLKIIKEKFDILTGNSDLKKKFESVKARTFKKTYEKNEDFNLQKISDEDWEIISNENINFYKEQIARIQKNGLLPKENKLTNTNNILNKNKNLNKNINTKNNLNKSKKPVQNPKKSSYIQNEQDKKLEEEIKADFKIKEKERQIEKAKIDKIIQEKEEERIKLEQELELKKKLEEEEKLQPPKVLTKEEKEQKWKEETFLKNTSSNERPARLPQTDDVSDLLPEISQVLEKLKKNFPQYVLGGDRNIWIVKPSGLSRGRGISCIDQLNDILTNIKIHNETVIQKYIENPLVIKGRKFDMRQWVLVTRFNPLTAYLFDTPYIRFGAEEFHLDDFKNIFSQLTGNSIAKHSEKFENSEIEGDMWEIEQFREYLQQREGKDVWPEIQNKIKKVVIYALECAKHKIMKRKNTFEILGFDIMIDELLNVYLIEINLSPDWSYSTKVTEKLIKIASEDIIRIVVDGKDIKEKTDVGRFKLIYNSAKFPKFDTPFVNQNYCE